MKKSLRTGTLSNATLRSAIFIIVCACLCVFLVSTLSCSELQVSRRLICAEKNSRDVVVRPSGIRRHCPLWTSCFSWWLISKINTSTQIVIDNRTRIHTQMHEEETDLNCSKLLFDSIISISLREKIRKKSHYDKWLISEHICREPWRKRDLNRPSLSSPPHPFKSKDTLCLNSGLLSTSHLHEC